MNLFNLWKSVAETWDRVLFFGVGLQNVTGPDWLASNGQSESVDCLQNRIHRWIRALFNGLLVRVVFFDTSKIETVTQDTAVN